MKPLICMLQKMLKDFIYEIYNLNETQNNIFQDLKCSTAFLFLVFVFVEFAVLEWGNKSPHNVSTVIFWLDATDHT